MPQQILVISPCDMTRQALCQSLHALGYPTVSTKTLTNPSDQEQQPELCIVDLQLSRDCSSSQWRSWLKDCHRCHSCCLAFDSSGEVDYNAIAELEPLCDTLVSPLDRTQLAGKVHSLLMMLKLTRQLNETRQQLSHYQNELQAALQAAAYIQGRLIPTPQPSYGHLHYAWEYIPCRQVGGDMFNITQLDEQTVMIYLLDVSGHGIASAMVSVSVHQSLSLHTSRLAKKPTECPPFYVITPPALVLQELDKEYPFERFEEFFTISYMLINPHTGQLRYSNAGHPPPLLIRSNGEVERLQAGGTVIGMGNLIAFEEGVDCLKPGDRIFMYTDGITEYQGELGGFYGEELFLKRLLGQQDKPLNLVTKDALITLREYGGSALPIDDITLVGVEFK